MVITAKIKLKSLKNMGEFIDFKKFSQHGLYFAHYLILFDFPADNFTIPNKIVT